MTTTVMSLRPASLAAWFIGAGAAHGLGLRRGVRAGIGAQRAVAAPGILSR